MNHKTILLDIDGVLADFVGATLALFGRQEVSVDRWNFHTQLGMTSNEMWNRIDGAGHDFWADMPKLPWADELVEMLIRSGLTTILCTSPSLSDGCNSGKVAWIRKNFPQFHRQFMITPCKHLLRGDFVLIDDSDDNVKKFRQNSQPAILFPQPWNLNMDLIANRIGYIKFSLEGLGVL